MENKKKLLITIGLLLIIGFFFVSFYSYKIAADFTKNELKYKSLPLSSDNVYSEIQRDLLKPDLISSLMAQDTFLRNWIINGEKNQTYIQEYLSSIKEKYNTSSSFFVSDKTRNYYYPEGILKKIHPSSDRDNWFYRLKKLPINYEANIDFDLASNDSLTIFTNYKVNDSDGNFLGITGVGLKTDHVSQLLEDYKQKYNHDIYFVDELKKIIISSPYFYKKRNLENLGILDTIIDRLNNQKESQQEYIYQDDKYIVNIRYIKELNLYLFIQAKESNFTQYLENTLYKNIAISTAIILIVMLAIMLNINYHQRKLVEFSKIDNLTSLPNRNYFDQQFDKILTSTRKADENISLILLDIDDFKKVNDEFGHLIGDNTLIITAEIIGHTFRKSDIVARWGGEEFIILLRDADKNKAYQLSEKLRLAIANDENLQALLGRPLTISAGVVEKQKDENKNHFFSRADQKLYESKKNGKNMTSK